MKTSEILPGDILFVGGRGIIKSLIEWITHSKYYHCAIFLDQETIAEFQGFRKSGISPISDYFRNGDKLVIYRDKSLNNQECEKIVKYALHQSGKDYDYKAIFEELIRYEFGVNIDSYNEGNKKICSSFVRDCFLNGIGKKLTEQKVPSPQDLIAGKKLKRIGKLKNN
jgi:uncharacterized protein YycO